MSKYRTPKERHWRTMFRKESFLEEKRRCYFCKTMLGFAESTADHLIPLSKGGQTVRENIRVSCKPCNKLKGSQSESKFLSMIKKPPDSNIPFEYWLVWCRRKIALQTIRSCDSLERMFIGMPVEEEKRGIAAPPATVSRRERVRC